MVGIKDFEMPETCSECRFQEVFSTEDFDFFRCFITGLASMDSGTRQRMRTCPLVDMGGSND